MKKLIWTALAMLASAASAALVVRIVDLAWRRIVGERPPEMPRWARLLVSPFKRRVEHRIETAAVAQQLVAACSVER